LAPQPVGMGLLILRRIYVEFTLSLPKKLALCVILLLTHPLRGTAQASYVLMLSV
jgi:hypothetical protein